MELINFIGAQASKDGKWLLVTFGIEDTEKKVRFLVPYEAKRGPIARVGEDGKTYVYFPMKKEEPKEEPKEDQPRPRPQINPNAEDIPF